MFTTMELVIITGVLVALLTYLGNSTLMKLKGDFITRGECKKDQDKCRQHTCQKITAMGLQITGLANEIERGREKSEQKRDAARVEYASQIKSIYDLIERTEENRASSLREIHTFMGSVAAKIEAIEKRLP